MTTHGPVPPFPTLAEAAALLGNLADDFAVLPGPPHAFPRFEIVPLAPRQERLAAWPLAILLDMDGTLTSTEPLCLRALEEVLRLATGHVNDPDWRGLNRAVDYPHLVGNSTTTHVAYIMETYADRIVPAALQRHALDAALWTLAHSMEGERLDAVKGHLDLYGLGGIWSEERLQFFLHDPWKWASAKGQAAHRSLVDELAPRVPMHAAHLRVAAGVDIYYRWWHGILRRIEGGEGSRVASEELGRGHRHPVMLMPGAGELLALTRGLLGEEAPRLARQLCQRLGDEAPPIPEAEAALAKIAASFEQHRVPTAVVTAASYYEAIVCLDAAFDALLEKIDEWPVSAGCRDRVRASFSEKRASFDLLVTADDATEMRLKPHRDLYTTALQRLGIEPEGCNRVIGIEDSPAGVTALRAAGIGLAVAVPLDHGSTGGCQAPGLAAAAHVLRGGLPELLARHGLFLGDGA